LARLSAIVRALPRQAWIDPDETGWRIGGQQDCCTSAWRENHRNVIDRFAGRGWPNAFWVSTMSVGWSTRLWPYDRFWWAIHQQVLAHLLRHVVEMSRRPPAERCVSRASPATFDRDALRFATGMRPAS
jgi:hypothetical protein